MRWTLVILVAAIAVAAIPGPAPTAGEPCIIVEEDGRVYVSPPDCVPEEEDEPQQDGGNP